MTPCMCLCLSYVNMCDETIYWKSEPCILPVENLSLKSCLVKTELYKIKSSVKELLNIENSLEFFLKDDVITSLLVNLIGSHQYMYIKR